jgi:hypothetical protein
VRHEYCSRIGHVDSDRPRSATVVLAVHLAGYPPPIGFDLSSDVRQPNLRHCPLRRHMAPGAYGHCHAAPHPYYSAALAIPFFGFHDRHGTALTATRSARQELRIHRPLVLASSSGNQRGHPTDQNPRLRTSPSKAAICDGSVCTDEAQRCPRKSAGLVGAHSSRASTLQM